MLTRFVIANFILFFVSNVFAEEKSVEELVALASKGLPAAQSGEYVVRTRYQRFDVLPPIQESVLERNPKQREQMERQQSMQQELRHASGMFNKDKTAIFRIVFDGDKQRIQRESGNRVTVYCNPYKEKDHSFFFMSEPHGMVVPKEMPPGISLPAPEKLVFYNKKDFDNLWRSGTSEDTTVPCVKTLGFFPDSTYQQIWCVDVSTYLMGYVRAISTNERPGLLITQEEFRKSLCVKIVLTLELRDLPGLPTTKKNGDPLTEAEIANIRESIIKKRNPHSRVEVYLDPSKEYAIRRMERYDSMIKVRCILENDLKQDESSGLWYPSHWVYEQYRRDQLEVREENTLEAISINKPIDPKRFTLESVEGLKPGTPVVWKLDIEPPGKGKLEWDGKEIFAHGEFGENNVMRGIDPYRARKRVIFLVCMNLAIISAFVAHHYYRRRSLP